MPTITTISNEPVNATAVRVLAQDERKTIRFVMTLWNVAPEDYKDIKIYLRSWRDSGAKPSWDGGWNGVDFSHPSADGTVVDFTVLTKKALPANFVAEFDIMRMQASLSSWTR